MRAVIHGTPIRDNQALKAPTVAQDIFGQDFVFAAIATVQPVIGAHHRPWLGLPHGNLKGGQVDFVQSARIDQRIDNHALGFLIIDGEMLDAGASAGRLHAGDKGDCHRPGEIRVFAVIFEIAPTKWATLDIDPGAEQNGNVFRLTLAADCDANLGNQVSVPAGRQRDGGRKAGGGHRRLHAQMVRMRGLFAEPMRAI